MCYTTSMTLRYRVFQKILQLTQIPTVTASLMQQVTGKSRTAMMNDVSYASQVSSHPQSYIIILYYTIIHMLPNVHRIIM